MSLILQRGLLVLWFKPRWEAIDSRGLGQSTCALWIETCSSSLADCQCFAGIRGRRALLPTWLRLACTLGKCQQWRDDHLDAKAVAPHRGFEFDLPSGLHERRTWLWLDRRIWGVLCFLKERNDQCNVRGYYNRTQIILDTTHLHWQHGTTLELMCCRKDDLAEFQSFQLVIEMA